MDPRDPRAGAAWRVLGRNVSPRERLALHWAAWRSAVAVDPGASLEDMVVHACSRRRISFRLFMRVIGGLEDALERGGERAEARLRALCRVVRHRGGAAARRELLPQLSRAHRQL